MHVRAIEGDIAERSADALVNAAGTSLRMGSGVAGALRRRGGEALNEAAVAKGPIDLGEVAVTDAFDLDAEVVIHAAAMPHDADGRATEASVRRATRNALIEADTRGCRSLVMPVLGTGAAGMDFEAGAAIVVETVLEVEPAHLEDVAIIAYGSSAHRTLEAILDERRDAPD